MKWLNEGLASILEFINIDLDSKLGSSLHFFIYDVIKISILLVILIFIVSYIQSYFPPERTKRILSHYSG
ncbi:MAG: permease, partial [Erysipelotrichaceae bacterium]